MIIFLAKIYEKSVAILDANCPLTRITLRAEKALRVTFENSRTWSRVDNIDQETRGASTGIEFDM